MRKGLGVVTMIVVYAFATWLVHQEAWAPPPLVSPESVSALADPLRSRPAPPIPSAMAAPPVIVPAPLAASAPGHRIDGHRWEGFLAKLRALEMGRRRAVRVIHLGDSELVADGPTQAIRQAMRARFGDAGLGFGHVASPIRWHVVEGFGHEAPTGMVAYTVPHGKLLSGDYGPAGIAFEAHAGARARVALSHRDPGVGCSVRLSFARRPGGGRVRVLADDVPLLEVATEGAGLGVAEASRAPCPRRLELTTHDGPSRLYGYEVRYDRPGITWSTLGVVGAQLTHLAHYAEGALEAGLAALEPDLVVLGYGLNRAAGPYAPPARYGEEVAGVIDRVRRGLPDAACLVIGPYPSGKPRDDGTVARVGEAVSRHQRAAAERAGCAFLDRFALAGGPTAAVRWASGHPRILAGDYQHMTARGAERMGEAIARVLLAQYEGTALPGAPLALDGP